MKVSNQFCKICLILPFGNLVLKAIKQFSVFFRVWCLNYKVTDHMFIFQGMVEAGLLKPITITWTPPQGHDVSSLNFIFI